MRTGTGQGTRPCATDLRPWAIVYDPAEGRMYEVVEIDAEGTIAVLLDMGADYDPSLPLSEHPTRRVAVVPWAVNNLRLIRPAPEYAPVEAARLPETAGTFRR